MLDLVTTAVRLGQKNISFLIWAVSIPLVATAGPFGTYASLTFGARLAYWGVIIVSSTLIGEIVHKGAARWAGHLGHLAEDGISILVMSVIYSPFVWILTVTFIPHEPHVLPPFWKIVFYVAIVGVGVTVARRKMHATPVPEPETGPELIHNAEPTPRLMRRLPSGSDGRVIRLNVNDHQVTVITTDGEYSLRLRFGDAIEEMYPIDGFCTHRSHWVAKQAVRGWEKDKGKTYLRLVNGDRVPVSRTYRPELEDAGLL